MTSSELPARISIGWRRDKRLSFTGLKENRTLAHCELSTAIRDLLEDIYVDAKPCDGTNIAKPHLGNHFRVRWAVQGGSKLRFYLATKGKLRPKYEVNGDARTARLRTMVEEAYDLARTEGQRVADSAVAVDSDTEMSGDEFQKMTDDFLARQLAEKATPPTNPETT